MCIKICEECLIKGICIDPCDKFDITKNEDIFYYLEKTVRLKRLKNYHKKHSVIKKYFLSDTESMAIGRTGNTSHTDMENHGPVFKIYRKYAEMRGDLDFKTKT